MKFANFIPAILGILGLTEFHEEAGKKVITDDEKAALKGYGFTDRFLADFAAALNEPTPAAATDNDKRAAVIAGLLGQTTEQLQAKTDELEALKASNAATVETLAAREREIADLKGKVATLSEMTETDPGAHAGRSADPATPAYNIQDEAQLGGRPGELFALDRPYNMRAKAALLAREGMLLAVNEASQMDYSKLRDDLGAFYRIPWRDRLQSFLVELPTLEKLFKLESGYQDLATLVNIWLGEFSQADNTQGSKFDNVTKGNYEFGHETLRMYGVMFAHRFLDLQKIEKLWIGSLNREGSNPIKWSFIEYLLVETAKKLHNERELRRVNGVRKNPDPNKPGRAMDASDGIYEYIRKKVEGHIDFTPDGGTTGKTVYQIKPFALPHITPANIGEVFYLGTSMIPSVFRDTGKIVLYVPSYMIPWYHKYNETKYGQNTDYKANIQYVKEFPGVRIEAIPNADNHGRIIWTIDGNIGLYEQKAGEMLNFQIEQEDWSLKVWSNWKEGLAALAVGYKYTDPADMDGSRQMIWCNDYDRPDNFFIDGPDGANPDATVHTSIQMPAGEFEITDIENAPVGKVISIKCTAPDSIEIKKTGNFSLLPSAWSPSKGDVIKVMKRADGKFIEISRIDSGSDSFQFDNDATELNVAGATVFVTGANTKATEISAITGAVVGTVYTIYGAGDANASTIANSGNFVLTKAMTLKSGTFIKLVAADGGKFYEIARG